MYNIKNDMRKNIFNQLTKLLLINIINQQHNSTKNLLFSIQQHIMYIFFVIDFKNAIRFGLSRKLSKLFGHHYYHTQILHTQLIHYFLLYIISVKQIIIQLLLYYIVINIIMNKDSAF